MAYLQHRSWKDRPGAVVGVVADAEIDAVTIGIRGNDDLVTA